MRYSYVVSYNKINIYLSFVALYICECQVNYVIQTSIVAKCQVINCYKQVACFKIRIGGNSKTLQHDSIDRLILLTLTDCYINLHFFHSFVIGTTCSKAVLGTMDIESQSHNIKVYVRTRPLSKEEYNKGENICVHVSHDERSLKV